MASVAAIQYFVCDDFDAGDGEMSRLLRVDVRMRVYIEPALPRGTCTTISTQSYHGRALDAPEAFGP